MTRKTILEAGLEEIINSQKRQLDSLVSERNQIEGGRLILDHVGTKVYFYEEQHKHRHGISKDKNRVHQLMRLSYLDMKIAELTSELELSKSLLERYKSTHKNSFGKLVNRFTHKSINIMYSLCSPLQLKYALAASMNPAFPENLRYELPDGRFTRNISERDIGRLLIAKHIAFQYECELIVDVTDMTGISYDFMLHGRKYKKYYPDFVIPLVDGSIFIWEHLGFITDEGYRFKQGVKLIAYLNGEIVDIRQLFYSFPKDLNNFKYLNHIIDTRIAPFV